MLQLFEHKGRTRILVLALLLTILAWMAPTNFAEAKAASNDTGVKKTRTSEKSEPANQSEKRGTKDIQAAKSASPDKLLPKSSGEKPAAKTKTAGHTFDIHIAGEYHQTKAYEMLRYANRTRTSGNQLQWDSKLEEMAMVRAAELPIYYSGEMRPNGEENYADYVAVNFDSAEELYQDLYQKYSYEGYFDDAAYTRFAAAAFKADNDVTYWAVLFDTERQGTTTPINKDYEDNNVYVDVRDRYLKWETEFLNANKDACSEKKLSRGKTYYAWIDVYNYDEERYCEDDPILLQTQASRSSNTGVLTIDHWGTIKTKKAGSASVKISPSESSEYWKTYNCTVLSAAAEKNEKAHKAYVSQIKKDKKQYCSGEKIGYAYKDLNGDGIDELLTYPGYGYCMEILYTYTQGKVKKLISLGQGDFEKYYLKKKVLYSNWGHMGYYYQEYYKFSGAKLVKKAYRQQVETVKNGKPASTYKYYIGKKKVSKSKYNAYVKKLTKGDKAKAFKKLKWKKY